jgi:hypothetical protein
MYQASGAYGQTHTVRVVLGQEASPHSSLAMATKGRTAALKARALSS